MYLLMLYMPATREHAEHHHFESSIGSCSTNHCPRYLNIWGHSCHTGSSRNLQTGTFGRSYTLLALILQTTKSKYCYPASCVTGVQSRSLAFTIVIDQVDSFRCMARNKDLDANALYCCQDHTNLLVEDIDSGLLWDEYGIIGNLIIFGIASSNQVQRQQRRDEPVREITHLVLDTLASRLRSYHSIVGVESLVFRVIRAQLIYIQSIVCMSGWNYQ